MVDASRCATQITPCLICPAPFFASLGASVWRRFRGSIRTLEPPLHLSPPHASPVPQVVWASAVGLGLPVLYVFSLGTCLLGNPRANAKELAYFATDSTATILLHAFVAR